ncbi:PAS domain S-box protein [Amorphus orientalis]|uniref:Diguanylate cyclase (GGDEF)-like protein/PAS domain S-box-containing protein n=1 Tax=Amorphus orientalis TaxID=649198 RepID=A0AAE3VNA8_9HYPH|nr:PAS domain S-box protein [Amorphus orientalis]MDQ0314811.1 diguanylate cyclase (GGDEF)-like protein/PAS domain S-box-containing protein [Amorphus orientalis]
MKAAAATAAVCFLLALLAIHFYKQPDQTAIIWLTNAVAIGVIVKRGYADTLATAIMVGGAIIGANLVLGTPATTALWLGLANSIEIAITVFLLRRIVSDPSPPLTVSAVTKIILAAVLVGPAVSSPIGAAILSSSIGLGYWDAFATWWIGTAIGSFSLLPPILLFQRSAFLATMDDPRKFNLVTGLLIFTAMVTIISVETFPHPYVLILLPVLFAASRLPPFETALVSSTALIIHWLHGVFIPTHGGEIDAALAAHVALAVAAVSPCIFAIHRSRMALAEQAVRESQAMFSQAMKDSAIGMAIVGLDGSWLKVNDAIPEMLGYSADELYELSFQDITHPDHLDDDLELLNEALQGRRETFRIEKRYIRKDGRVIWALLAVSVVRDQKSGQPRFFISQIEDIDERKRTEAALAESEARWKFALDGSGQAVWDTNLVTGEAYRSPYWYRLLGYEPASEGARAEDWLNLVHPDDRETVQEADRRMLSGETPETHVEIRLLHRSGRWIWVEDRGRVVEWDENGRPVRLIGTHVDISDRKARENDARLARERLELAVQAGQVGIWEINPRTDRISANDRTLEIFGIPRTDFDGSLESFRGRLHPEDRDMVMAAFRIGMSTSEQVALEHRIVRDAGEVRYLKVLAKVVHGADGKPDRIVGTHWDTTEHRKLIDELFQEKERLQITLHSIGDAVITTDAQAKITYINPVAEELTGWKRAEAVGHPISRVFRLVDDETNEPILSPVEECLELLQPVYLREGAILITHDGSRLHVQDSAAPVRANSGELIGAVLVFQDITRTRSLHKELAFAALNDTLTGLPNRLSLERSLEALCAEAKKSADSHALCFLDLDRFKIVNDSAGHVAGDALLIEVGRLLKVTLRPTDLVARIGGDEFALLLRRCPIDKAQEAAERVAAAFRTFAFHWEGRTYDVGASIGIAEIRGSDADPMTVMKEADVACYAAKSAGRGQVSVYTDDGSDAGRHLREINIAADLRSAIEEDRLTLFGQAIVELEPERGAPHRRNVEVLIRMFDRNGDLIAPGAFIPAAERYGLMNTIDRWVISTLLERQVSAFQDDPSLCVSVNLSANSLDDPELWPFVHARILASGVAPERICFEITETAVVQNLASATYFVRSAKELGCRISLDDFGVGLSSFSYLKDFRVDELKIDGSFVRQVSSNRADTQIVKAIIGVGRTLGISSVAEWVENAETLETLRTLGINGVQGYHLGGPKPFAELCRDPELDVRRIVAA